MTIETYALPKLGKKDVADITRDDVLSVLVPLWQTKTQTAKKLRQRLEVVFDFCLRRGWRTAENPARWRAGLEFDLPSPQRVREVVHHEAPTLEELQNAVPRLMNSISGKMILFGILTGRHNAQAAARRLFCCSETGNEKIPAGTRILPHGRDMQSSLSGKRTRLN